MKNKAILITGASSGIGNATTLLAARAGYRVFAGVRTKADADLLRAGHANIDPILLDVTQKDALQKAFDYVSQEVGEEGLYALINNAGINYVAPFEFAEEAKVRQLMEVHVFGTINLTQTFLPLIHRAAKNRRDPAKVINIGSIGSVIGLPWEFSYHTAKFAVLGMSQSLRFELEPLNIKVTCVMPGGVKTKIFAKTNVSSDEARNRISGVHADYYQRNLTNVNHMAGQLEKYAVEPEKAARVILDLLRSANPPLRKLIGLDASFINTLSWLGLVNLMKGQLVKR
jgi:NAD(P)-dependent dehydrogenase (short-subunit alcohol dehydrogenase family)